MSITKGSVLLEGVKMEAEDDDPSDDWSDNIIVVIESVEKIKEKEKKKLAKKLLDINCYISVSGIITFKNSTELVDAVSSIPIEKLLVETDSPYLAPLPYRGKSNEPSYIIHTVKKLSQIKKVSKEKVIANTTNNFRKLFDIN